MQTSLNVAPDTTAIKGNGHDNSGVAAYGAPGIVLRNALPVAILPQAQVSPHTRHLMIQTGAYFLAQRRGFVPGHELDDWLAAEAMIGQELVDPRSSC